MGGNKFATRDDDERVGGGGLVPDSTIGSGRGDNEDDWAFGGEGLHCARRGLLIKEHGGFGAANVDAAAKEAEANSGGVFAVRGEDRMETIRYGFALQTERAEIGLAAFAECEQLQRLAAFDRDDVDAVVPIQRKDGRATAADRVALLAGSKSRLARKNDFRVPGRDDRGRGHGSQSRQATFAAAGSGWFRNACMLSSRACIHGV